LNLDPSSRLDAKAEAADQPGRLVALDLGDRRVGLAVSDERRITASTLPFIERRSWKDLLQRVASVIEAYDARALVIGLPLALDGSERNAAQEARRLAENFRRSLNVPVYLQDERLTSFEAGREMRAGGAKNEEIADRIDSEAAAIILRDFMARS
jgi:putative Holliday junction resolvase